MVKVGVVAAVGALLLGGLGACGSDPKPKIADPPPSPSVHASPSVSPSHAAETPDAFLRRYVRTFDAAQVSGDFAAYRTLVTKDCIGCNNFIRGIRRIHQGGGVIRFAGERVIWIHRLRNNFYRVRTFSPPTRYKESAHGAWKRLPGGDETVELTLESTRGRFVVTDMEQVAGS